jgi:hypothetical protein
VDECQVLAVGFFHRCQVTLAIRLCYNVSGSKDAAAEAVLCQHQSSPIPQALHVLCAAESSKTGTRSGPIPRMLRISTRAFAASIARYVAVGYCIMGRRLERFRRVPIRKEPEGCPSRRLAGQSRSRDRESCVITLIKARPAASTETTSPIKRFRTPTRTPRPIRGIDHVLDE